MDAQLVTGKKSEKVRKRQLVSAEVSNSRLALLPFSGVL